MAQDGMQVRIGTDSNGQQYASIAVVRPDGKVTYLNCLHTPGKSFAEELSKAVAKAEKFRQTGTLEEVSK